MKVLRYAEAEADFDNVLDRAVCDREPVVVVRDEGEAVVFVSLADWPVADETDHLLGSQENAVRLASAIRQLDAGAPST